MAEEYHKNTKEKIENYEESIKLAKKLSVFFIAFFVLFVLISFFVFSLNLFYTIILLLVIEYIFFISIKDMRARIEFIKKHSCNNCGSVNQEGAIHCQKCGGKLE